MHTSDLIVIGASRGSQALALHAAQQGQRVVLFEQDPARHHARQAGVMAHAMQLCSAMRQARHGATAGIQADFQIDPAAMLQYIRQQADHPTAIVEHENITLITGSARFAGPMLVSHRDETYRAKRIVIATGCGPHTPEQELGIAGLHDAPVFTPATLFEQTALPGRVAIIGAGPTGVSLAQWLATMGATVHLIEKEDRPLPKAVASVSQLLEQTLAADGVQLHKACYVTSISHRDSRFTLRCADENEIIAEAIVLATGHQPRTASLDVAKAGVTLDEQGYIKVDAKLQTTAADIYAIGSCIEQPAGQTTASASLADSQRLIENGQGRRRVAGDRPALWTLHTHPQVGHVGMTPPQAELAGYRIAQRHESLQNLALPMAGPGHEGFIDVLFDQPSGRLLGVTLAGPDAAQAIAWLGPMIAQGMAWQDLASISLPDNCWPAAIIRLCAQPD